MIRYTVFPVSPKAHLFEVELSLDDPGEGAVLLTMPAWIPGSYMIRDFARNLVTLTAWSGDSQLVAEKTDKQTWRIARCGGTVKVKCQVYAWDLSVRGAHLDQTHAYFNGTSLFLKVRGREHEPCEVRLRRPDGDGFSDWRVATTLKADGVDEFGFGLYRAKHYADLIDHPVEMGTFISGRFNAAGVDHLVAITGRQRADIDRLCADLKRICEQHAGMFGGLPAMDRYLFQVTAVGEGYGGLEHRTSTSLLCNRDDLPVKGAAKVSEGYRKFLGLCSHEYFHLWNVKRIQPQALKETDLAAEAYTRQLWAFEGITSYYDDLALVRSGVIPAESYLEVFAQTVTRVMRSAGRHKQTLAESSFDAWTRFYKQDENAPNAIISYYVKGSLVAFALDLEIRRLTADKRCLDDVMRLLWKEYGAPERGVPEGGVERAAEAVAGADLGGFFDRMLRGTTDPPLRELFLSLGIGFSLRSQKGPEDLGGLAGPEPREEKNLAALGARYKAEGSGVRLEMVFDGGTAQACGLSAGDLLVAVDGLMVRPGGIGRQLADLGVGAKVPAHAFRRDELMEFDMTLQAAPEDTCELWLLPDADADAVRRRNQWLALAS